MSSGNVKVGIIAGTGLDNKEILQSRSVLNIDTPFGKPSSEIVCGKMSGVDVALIFRHGRGHTIMPSNVNYRVGHGDDGADYGDRLICTLLRWLVAPTLLPQMLLAV